jgi:hypothetical protein
MLIYLFSEVDNLPTVIGRVVMKFLFKIIFMLIFLCIASIPISSGKEISGTVTISYVLDRIPAIASNQIAVWIEDEDGNYIKTLFATKFSAEGGFRKRTDTLPEWVEKSGWNNAAPEEIDAVSGATPHSGTITVVWDLTDKDGKQVSAGTYIYKIEGIIYWKNRVVWEGRINVRAGEENTSLATPTYFPPEAAKAVIPERGGTEQIIENGLVRQVKAVYTP